MANILVHKIGSGKPADNKLATGEFGVDIDANILWVGTDSGEAVELSGGDIKWNQIIDVPIEIIQIIDKNDPNYISIADLEGRVDANEIAINKLISDLGDLETQVGLNASNISANADAILVNAGAISTNTTNIATNKAQIEQNKKDIATNTGNIASNKNEIDDLWTALGDGLTGLTLGGQYDAAVNVVRNPTTEGIEAGLRPGEALPATEGTKGVYVIVTVEGPLDGTGIAPIDGGRADGETAYVGDWLVSDGVHGWVLFSFHTDSTQWGTIGGVLGNQTDLAEALAGKVGVDDTIGGGNYNL